jgi:hypothetical protein
VKSLDLLKTDILTNAKAFAKDVFIDQERKRGDRNGGHCRCLVAELRLKYPSTTKKKHDF